MTAKSLQDWIQSECPPLSWNIVTMALFKDFHAKKINLRPPDDTPLPDDLLKKVDALVEERWQKHLPQFQTV